MLPNAQNRVSGILTSCLQQDLHFCFSDRHIKVPAEALSVIIYPVYNAKGRWERRDIIVFYSLYTPDTQNYIFGKSKRVFPGQIKGLHTRVLAALGSDCRLSSSQAICLLKSTESLQQRKRQTLNCNTFY